MINRLGLGCSDHCLLKINKKIEKKKSAKKIFFGFFGISIPGDHITDPIARMGVAYTVGRYAVFLF